MSKPGTIRKYGKQLKKTKCDRLFAELPQTPVRPAVTQKAEVREEEVENLVQRITAIEICDENSPHPSPGDLTGTELQKTPALVRKARVKLAPESLPVTPADRSVSSFRDSELLQDLSVLSWAEVCPLGDKIVKIAEASYAEVYRVTNERGTSIIKVIRMKSAIRAKTKAQERAGLVDEEPHPDSDLMGELQISEWLADIPGFVMYKERYIVQGKTCRELLETHQAFQKKVKRQDPGRLQFYPSPSRYLEETKFLVVELGDAGTALEDFRLESSSQLWDIFFHVAIALARAETQIEFEHRDLHEGNLCIRRTESSRLSEDPDSTSLFGHSGLEITILDYGLSRANGSSADRPAEPIAYDLERDLSMFTSDHAPQCQVYRQMRSFMLRGDRTSMPREAHSTPYESGINGPISWTQHEPYTNVLWLAYIYTYLTTNFQGPRKELNDFKRATKDFWMHIDPETDDSLPGFASASDVVAYAIEAGWVDECQLMGSRDDVEKSIISVLSPRTDIESSQLGEMSLRRSPRKRLP